MTKYPEGEHADLHLETENSAADEAEAEAEATTAEVEGEEDWPEDEYRVHLEDPAAGAKALVALLGSIAAVALCVAAIVVGRKLASKD